MLDISKYSCLKKVIEFFEEFSKIPHGSSNTEKIADYLVDFAKTRGLYHRKDENNNVIIRKPATPGFESRPTVILQGHTDMVLAKTPSSKKDLYKEGLELYIDGDFLKAKDTTLGGDDGIAIAYALAVLDSDSIAHPEIEAVFTSDEEIGLLGAASLDTGDIKGRILINIDSDAEGIFTVGCAGGMRSDIALDVSRASVTGKKTYKFRLYGFKGGHSGVEIDKGRINAVKALSEVLLNKDILIVSLEGGNADNAIPREATAVFYSDESTVSNIRLCANGIKEKHSVIEPSIDFSICECDTDASALTAFDTNMVLSLLSEVPSGVIKMSEDIPGLVETSLNLGIMRTEEKNFSISFSVRGGKEEGKRQLGDRLKEIADKYNATYSERGEYPAWEYRKDSHLRDVMVSVYEKMYKKSPSVLTIHAGLECGIFAKKIPGVDCVSIGPDNFDIHTTEERLSLSSSERVFEFLIKVLAEI